MQLIPRQQEPQVLQNDVASDQERWASFGALVLCIKLTSSLPVLQIPILNYEINYLNPTVGLSSGPPQLGWWQYLAQFRDGNIPDRA